MSMMSMVVMEFHVHSDDLQAVLMSLAETKFFSLFLVRVLLLSRRRCMIQLSKTLQTQNHPLRVKTPGLVWEPVVTKTLKEH